MGSTPKIGEARDDVDREYNEHRCVCCWKVVVPARNPIPVCIECAGKLTPGERAAIVFGIKQTKLLRDIDNQLTQLVVNDESDGVQLGRIARTFEEFGITLKEVLKRMGGDVPKKGPDAAELVAKLRRG